MAGGWCDCVAWPCARWSRFVCICFIPAAVCCMLFNLVVNCFFVGWPPYALHLVRMCLCLHVFWLRHAAWESVLRVFVVVCSRLGAFRRSIVRADMLTFAAHSAVFGCCRLAWRAFVFFCAHVIDFSRSCFVCAHLAAFRYGHCFLHAFGCYSHARQPLPQHLVVIFTC